jgi:hypothetical protein
MYIVFEYLDEHKEVLLSENFGRNESSLANEYMRKFIGWLRDQISQPDTHTNEYLKKLACGPIFIVVTYQGYDIDGYTLYTEQQEIWELDFHSFKIPLFCWNWVDANKGVVKDKYGFISIDLNYQGYKSEPSVLAKHLVQVFYVQDTTNKQLKMVIPTKQRIVGVENVIDE